ncbi:hypothetical protein KEM56_006210 [Ascosphaera pollenicola]|nr:hypothetical protein KEM56_006210 [Ascosphaera pollenicola]
MSKHINKIAFTCPFWREGKCKFSDATCKYAHRETGATAKKPKGWIDYPDNKPRSSRTSEAPLSEVAEVREEEDLIHFSDKEEKKPVDVKKPRRPEESDAGSITGSSARIASQKHRKSEFESVLQSLRIEPPLNATIRNGDFDAVKEIIEKEYREQGKVELDPSLLIIAVWQKHPSRDIIQLLLSYQADPCAVPRSLWCSDDEVDQVKATPSSADELTMARLARNVGFDLKYLFRRAWKLRDSIKADLNVTRLLGLESLVRAPYHVIGQDYAISNVLATVKVHLSLPNSNGSPLVLVFAGPQGHGKRLLARQITHNMTMRDAELEEESCQNGRKNPNNEDDWSPNVTYCDLEATTGRSAISQLQSMLNEKQGMPRAIIILSTTHGEKDIITFSREHLQYRSNQLLKSAPWSDLIQAVADKLCDSYGSSFVSLVDGIIPFVPFSKEEQIALVHQYIVDIKRDLELDGLGISISPEGGHAKPDLQLRLDPRQARNVCSRIASKGYNPRLGAHSLERRVHSIVKTPLALQYLNAVAACTSPDAPNDEETADRIVFHLRMKGEEVIVSQMEWSN